MGIPPNTKEISQFSKEELRSLWPVSNSLSKLTKPPFQTIVCEAIFFPSIISEMTDNTSGL